MPNFYKNYTFGKKIKLIFNHMMNYNITVPTNIPNGRKLSHVVHTKLGPIQGLRHQLSSGQWADIFLGIPFAKPPIGDLRFECPESPEPWTDVLQAVEFKPGSISLEDNPTCSQSEDCLQLNIFCPSISSNKSNQLPVLFYIHGGGFCSGSAQEYGYQGWTENFIPENLLLITVQYRLGPFGFLTLGDGTALPGNLGYWDLALALHFVHENITNFGGDPQCITVVGLSAGGAAATALAVSPWTRDWVRASVEMSGTGMAGWSVGSERAVRAGLELASKVLEKEGMHTDSSHVMDLKKSILLKQRLKTMSIDEIMQIVREMPTCRLDPNLLVWGPRLDGKFLPKDFATLLCDLSTRPKPALMGVTENEAIYFVIQGKDEYINPFGISRNSMSTYGATEFRTFVEQLVCSTVPNTTPEKSRDRMISDIFYFYANDICDKGFERQKNGTTANNTQITETLPNEICAKITKEKIQNDFNQRKGSGIFYLRQHTRLVSDLLFNMPLFSMAHQRIRQGMPTFLYLNRYFNPEQFEPWIPFKGATHGNEYAYINGLYPIGNFEMKEQDMKHRRVLINILSSFVKHGVPSINDERNNKWPDNDDKNAIDVCSKESLVELKFVVIDDNIEESCKTKYPTLKSNHELFKSHQFWKDFSRKYGFDLITGIPCDS